MKSFPFCPNLRENQKKTIRAQSSSFTFKYRQKKFSLGKRRQISWTNWVIQAKNKRLKWIIEFPISLWSYRVRKAKKNFINKPQSRKPQNFNFITVKLMMKFRFWFVWERNWFVIWNEKKNQRCLMFQLTLKEKSNHFLVASGGFFFMNFSG